MILLAQHAAIAAWASITHDLVGLHTHRWITRIQYLGRLLAQEPIAFAGIKPDTHAVSAAINLHAIIFRGLHITAAFRANHA